MLLLTGTPAADSLAAEVKPQRSRGRKGGRRGTAVKALAAKVKSMKVNMSPQPNPL